MFGAQDIYKRALLLQAGALPQVSDSPVAHAALLLFEWSPSSISQWAWEMNYQEKTKRGRPQRPLLALGLIPGLRLFSSEKKKIEEYSFFLTLSPENKKSLLPLQRQVISNHRFVTITFPTSLLPRLFTGKLLSELFRSFCLNRCLTGRETNVQALP